MLRQITSYKEAKKALIELPVGCRIYLHCDKRYFIRKNKTKWQFVTPFKVRRLDLRQATSFLQGKIVKW